MTKSRLKPCSRYDNPFATCWTRPNSLPWVPVGDHDVVGLIDRLDHVACAQIVGPHGCGKSTLLQNMTRELLNRGEHVFTWTMDGAGRRNPFRLPRNGYLFVDGYEQLGLYQSARARVGSRMAGVRLLVTTHRRRALPTLVELSPSATLLEQLLKSLLANRPSPVTLADARLSFARHGGNLREVWFDLYDLHERLANDHLCPPPRTETRCHS